MNLRDQLKRIHKQAVGKNFVLTVANFHTTAQTAGFKCGDRKLKRLPGESIESIIERAISLFKKRGQSALILGYKDEL